MSLLKGVDDSLLNTNKFDIDSSDAELDVDIDMASKFLVLDKSDSTKDNNKHKRSPPVVIGHSITNQYNKPVRQLYKERDKHLSPLNISKDKDKDITRKLSKTRRSPPYRSYHIDSYRDRMRDRERFIMSRRRSRTRTKSRDRIKRRDSRGRRIRSRSRSITTRSIRRRSRSRSSSAKNKPRRLKSRSKSPLSLRPSDSVMDSTRDKNRYPPPDVYLRSLQQATYQTPSPSFVTTPPAPMPYISAPVPLPVPAPYDTFSNYSVPPQFAPVYDYSNTVNPQIPENNTFSLFDQASYAVPAPEPVVCKETQQRISQVLNRCTQAIEILSEPHLPNILFGNPFTYTLKHCEGDSKYKSPMWRPSQTSYNFTSGIPMNTVVQNISSMLNLNPFVLEKRTFPTHSVSTQTDPDNCEKCLIRDTKKTFNASTHVDFGWNMKNVSSQVNTDELATTKLFKSKNINNTDGNAGKSKSFMHMTAAEILTASEKPPHSDFNPSMKPFLNSRPVPNDQLPSNNIFNRNNNQQGMNRQIRDNYRPQPMESYRQPMENFRQPMENQFRHEYPSRETVRQEPQTSIEKNLMQNQRNLSNATISSMPMMKQINMKNLPVTLLLSSLCKSSNKPANEHK